MSYKIESLTACTKKLSFNFSNVDLTKQVEAALAQKQKSANLKGFRAGKAPLALVKQVYGAEAEMDAVNKFIQDELFQAIDKETLKVVGMPSLSDFKFENKEISFEATVETYPEVTIPDYSKYTFTQEAATVADDELAKSREGYFAGKSQMVELSDAAAKLTKGHFAVFNFEGVKEDGSRPENMKGKEFLLEIGSGQFIPGFEDAMIGMKKAEKKDIKLTFPADYHFDELKNAKVTFEVELLEIKEKKFPELNDALVKELGFDSVEDFNKKTKDALMWQKERQVKEKLHQQIIEKLVADSSFDVPASMIDSQEKHLKEELKQNLKSQGFNDTMMTEYFTRWAADLNQKAVFQVKSGLILDKLAKDFSIETSEKDLDAKFQEMSQKSGIDLETVKAYYGNNKQLKNNLFYAIREEKTFGKVLEKIKLT